MRRNRWHFGERYMLNTRLGVRRGEFICTDGYTVWVVTDLVKMLNPEYVEPAENK